MNEYEMAKARVLVTGASGFIGSHLCKRLRGLGCEVHGVSRVQRFDDEKVFRWWKSDLSEPSEIYEIVKSIRADFIFHLSSLVTGSRNLEVVLPTFQANLASTVNLLSALSKVGCQRMVLVGSMEEPSLNGLIPGSISPYAASKWGSSIYGRLFHSLYHLPVVIPNLFMVYGPGQLDHNKLIPYVTLSLLRNQAPKLTSGSREVDWIYVDDVVEGLVACVKAEGVEGETIEIGSGKLFRVRKVVEELTSLINSKVDPDFTALEDRTFENVRVADTKRASELLHWKAQVSLKEGLRRTVSWYREQLVRDSFNTWANDEVRTG